jgi:hypothetical protein
MSYQEQGGGGESVVVNGTVEGMEIKNNGRIVVKVREIGSNSQYALSLNTKEQGLAQQMGNSIGQAFSFICGLSHWTNNQGQPVTSKWINGVAPLQGGMQQAPPQQQYQGQPQQQMQGQPQQWGGQPQQQQMPPQQQQPQYVPQVPQSSPQGDQRPTDDAYIRRVSWLAALEPAVAALVYLPEEQRSVAALVKMADFFAQTAIKRGQQGFGQQAPQQQAPPPQQQQQPQPQQGWEGDPGPQAGDPNYAQGGMPTDDDIPFAPAIH